MSWNIDFGLASLFILGVLLAYNLIRRDLPLRKNLMFNALLITIAAADIFYVASSAFENAEGNVSSLLSYACLLGYYMVIITVPVLLCFMVIALTGRLGMAAKRTRFFTMIFFIITEIFIITTPITGFIFSYNEEYGIYEARPGFYFVNVAGGVILLFGCLYIRKYKSASRMLQRRSVYLFTLVSFAASFIQMYITSGMNVISFGFTLSALIMYIAVQNPDSFRDQRTGIYSKGGFDELQKELFREGQKSSILCFTFANYDILKKTYGDEIMLPCLRAIANFLKNEVCSKNVLPFYMHNGRFLLMKTGFYDFSEEKTIIDSRFLNPWTASGISFQFSPAYAYISSEIKMSKMVEVDSLIDKALTDALNNGAFSFISIDEELLYETHHEVKIRKALDNALENDSLEVWFQPIWSPAANRINSAEALVRIHDSELGTIYPDEFIKTAEANGSIMTLGRQVYDKICAFISANDIKKYGLDYIEVNLSPIQCLNEHLADEFIGIRKSYGIDSRLINLEITETAASDSPIMVENMLKLSRDGFSFSLDDYGTGYSNLMNMLSLPLNIIKIDKSIVWSYFDQSFAMSLAAGSEEYVTTTVDDGENNILEDLIPMFQSRGLKVVCEGVETHEMVRVLEEMGCDYMQGFFFSKPIPENEFLDYVRAKNRNTGVF